MSSSKVTIFVCLLTCFLNCSASKVSQVITVKPGEDVTLQCEGPRDAGIELLEWIKPDLKSEDYVFFIREMQLYEDYQNPSFHGRVKLRNPTMNDGDFSVILRNAEIDDTGTYECYVGKSNSGRRKRDASELISSITLKVEDHITAKYGEKVVLPCQDFSNTPVTGLEWIRPDLNQAGNVFLSRDGRTVPDNQHPYFKDWVELKNREMKDGDASLILKYAMTVDSGTYECYVNQGGTKRMKRSINLYVPPLGPSEDGENKAGGD